MMTNSRFKCHSWCVVLSFTVNTTLWCFNHYGASLTCSLFVSTPVSRPSLIPSSPDVPSRVYYHVSSLPLFTSSHPFFSSFPAVSAAAAAHLGKLLRPQVRPTTLVYPCASCIVPRLHFSLKLQVAIVRLMRDAPDSELSRVSLNHLHGKRLPFGAASSSFFFIFPWRMILCNFGIHLTPD